MIPLRGSKVNILILGGSRGVGLEGFNAFRVL